MWYEQFYSGIVTFGFVAAALYVSAPLNYLDTGRWNRRDGTGLKRDALLKRDHRLTGNFYKLSGLDSIKD